MGQGLISKTEATGRVNSGGNFMEGIDNTGEGRAEKPGGKKQHLDASKSRKLRGGGCGEGYRAQGQGSPSGIRNHSGLVWDRVINLPEFPGTAGCPEAWDVQW